MRYKGGLTFVCALLLSFFGVTVVNSQNGNSNPSATPNKSISQDPVSEAVTAPAKAELPPVSRSSEFLSEPEVRLTIAVALIGLIALALEYLLLRRIKNLQAEEALRVFGVTLILIGTFFFVAAGFGAQQIAPALGLFGTIAGYLLGRAAGKGERSDGKTEES